ncbi:unnamed protein product, partial [marine sediment metagenome]
KRLFPPLAESELIFEFVLNLGHLDFEFVSDSR